MKNYILFILFGFFLSGFTIEKKDALVIGQRIWKNECKGTIEGLTTWNEGEEFASLGIGHFIWYTADKKGPFQEMFPQLLTFLESARAIIPLWLQKEKTCPWKTREDFYRSFRDQKMQELRRFLAQNIDLQALFMANRLEQSLPKILENLSSGQKKDVEEKFRRVAAEPLGMYALLDYVNFKGEGTSPQERYQNKGWGLLQVLQNMPASSKKSALEDFAAAAKTVLTERVENSPPERNERRWLAGWVKRLETYTN